MRERERQAMERRQEREDCFKVLKERLANFLSMPVFKRNLEVALSFPRRDKQEQEAWFQRLVETYARLCLTGEPEYEITPEFQCHALIKMGHLAHARPALERAVVLYRQSRRRMPQRLSEWAENPGGGPPRQRGPRPVAQDWTALRDQIIGMAMDWAVGLQEDPRWPAKLSVRRHGVSNGKTRDLSICQAVVEVLKETYGADPKYHLPTYRMVYMSLERYRGEIGAEGRRRPGRSLLPPGGLDSLIRPEGNDTASMQRAFLRISKKHLSR